MPPSTEGADVAAGLIEVPIPVAGRAPVVFRLAAEGTGGPFFSLGIRKSGSTLLHKIVAFLAERNGILPVDVPGDFFAQGMRVANWMRCDLAPLLRPGHVLLGFRTFPGNIATHQAFREGRKVLMVRDPRDALVSQYFSDAWSHPLPAQGAEHFLEKREAARASAIDDFVIEKARNLDKVLLACRPLLDDPRCMLLRYESEVLAKPRLIARLLDHFGWRCPDADVARLLAEVDEVPDTEDPRRFVRRVLPGDHREKLAPATIARLDHLLAASREAFGYR